MSNATVYENLYNNMKNRFTVVNENAEYTLGEYMLMKAGKKQESTTLPAVRSSASANTAVVAFVKYVNDKLTVKTPPVKDKTIRAFPFRTAAAAFASALITCSLIISFGSVTAHTLNSDTPASIEIVEEIPESEFEAENK
ncbi:MAG: hypothetical protein J6V09_03455 [Clostridia bacterium]|nr:hypothetical protein [Clostridia bacterium]